MATDYIWWYRNVYNSNSDIAKCHRANNNLSALSHFIAHYTHTHTHAECLIKFLLMSHGKANCWLALFSLFQKLTECDRRFVTSIVIWCGAEFVKRLINYKEFFDHTTQLKQHCASNENCDAWRHDSDRKISRTNEVMPVVNVINIFGVCVCLCVWRSLFYWRFRKYWVDSTLKSTVPVNIWRMAWCVFVYRNEQFVLKFLEHEQSKCHRELYLIARVWHSFYICLHSRSDCAQRRKL